MSHRSILSRLALASLVAACVAAPTASAIDPQGTATTDPRQQDMHASTVAQADPATATQDARGESAAGGGTSSGGPVREPRVGPPTWPAYPTPLPRPEPVPVATDPGDDVGLDLPVALLILAGALALGGGLAVAALKLRVHTRTA